MTHPSRRALIGGAASLIALSAGCLGDGSETEPDDGDDNGSPDTDDEEDGGDDLPDALAGYETRAYQYPDRSTSPAVRLLQRREPAENWLDERETTPDGLPEFVAETDFGTSILVPVEAGAPSPCHEMVLESIGIDERDDALALEAAVRETADDDEVCAAQEKTVGRLVRATFESEPLTKLSVGVTDRNGRRHEIPIPSDSASDSANEGDGSSGSDTAADSSSGNQTANESGGF